MPVAIEKIAVLRATRSLPPPSPPPSTSPRGCSGRVMPPYSSPKLPSGMPMTSPAGSDRGSSGGSPAPVISDKAAIVRRCTARPVDCSRAGALTHGQHPFPEEADPALRARAPGEPPLHVDDQDLLPPPGGSGRRAASESAAESTHRELVSTIDKAVKRGAMHQNTGARKKSRQRVCAPPRPPSRGRGQLRSPPAVVRSAVLCAFDRASALRWRARLLACSQASARPGASERTCSMKTSSPVGLSTR